jgi:hypothetical protein
MVSMRRGPTPSHPHSVLNDINIIPGYFSLGRGFALSGGGYAETVVLLVTILLGGSWDQFSQCFALFSHFGTIFVGFLGPSSFEVAF